MSIPSLAGHQPAAVLLPSTDDGAVMKEAWTGDPSNERGDLVNECSF
jgi:hypothetical protein